MRSSESRGGWVQKEHGAQTPPHSSTSTGRWWTRPTTTPSPGTEPSPGWARSLRCGVSTARSGWAATSSSPHAAGQDVEERHGDDLRDAWREEYAKIRAEVRPLQGAADLVRALSDDGIRIALASSGDPEFAREAVDLLGIGDLVEVLTTAEDVDGSKPEPDLIAVTLDRLGGVERAVFVGDTPYDVQAADRAGMGCIALLTGGFGSAELTGGRGVEGGRVTRRPHRHRLAVLPLGAATVTPLLLDEKGR